MRLPALLLLTSAVLLSGGAGLMYQVAWTRRLISVTSATATAQGFVLAVFMAGLGIGAFLAGRWAGRLRRPLLGYAAVETAAAGLAVLSFPVLAGSEAVRGALAPLGAGGALWGQLAAVSLYLLVPTTLLGASLPLLVDVCERGALVSAATRGRIVSALYGFNTLGAALGCWLAGFVTVERFGLSRTAYLGAGLALAAAGLALAAGRGRPAPRSEAPAGAPVPVERRLLACAFLAGFAGLGAEVLWTRLVGLIVPNTVYAFSQVLIAVLLGIVAGAGLAGVLARRLFAAEEPRARVVEMTVWVAALGAVLMALIPLVVVGLADHAAVQSALAGGRSPLAALRLLVCLVLASAFVAAVLPLLVMASRHERGAQVFGSLYALNTAGSVLGSLVTGFLLLPALGIRFTGALLEAACLGAAWLLAGARIGHGTRVLGLAAATCVVLLFAHDVPRQVYEMRLPAGTRVVDFHEGVSSHVMVTDDARHRLLWINSNRVAGSYGGHRVLAHLPALLVPEFERSLGIALGTGQTFAAALMHGAREFDCVEIDAGVIELSRRWFGAVNGHLFEDPRVTVHVDDGRAFLRATDARYDLIVLEPLQAWSAGTSNLYSREFYEEAAARLSERGVLAQWIPFYGQGPEETRAMVRTALEVFATGSLWLAANDAVLVLSQRPLAVSLDAIGRRIEERGLTAELRRFPIQRPSDLGAFFLLGPTGLARWTEGAEVLVDDRPFLEFRAARRFGREAGDDNVRAILRSVRPHLDTLERFLVDASPEQRERTRHAALIRDAMFAQRLLPGDALEQQVELAERLPRGARDSAVWAALYRSSIERWARSPQTLARGPDAMRAIYERGRTQAPELEFSAPGGE